jgi:hypothetical protein
MALDAELGIYHSFVILNGIGKLQRTKTFESAVP